MKVTHFADLNSVTVCQSVSAEHVALVFVYGGG